MKARQFIVHGGQHVEILVAIADQLVMVQIRFHSNIKNSYQNFQFIKFSLQQILTQLKYYRIYIQILEIQRNYKVKVQYTNTRMNLKPLVQAQQKKHKLTQYMNNLSLLLQTEMSLDFTKDNKQDTNCNIFDKVFSSNLSQINFQIKLQQNKIKRLKASLKNNINNSQYIQNSIYKITELMQKQLKVKQFYIYCNFLKQISKNKKQLSLSQSIQRYMEFQKKQNNLIINLKHYLNTQVVSDLIFKQYLKSYNVNIYTADLIQYYFSLNQNNLLKTTSMIFEIQRIPELLMLQKKNISFKQLCQISQQYSQIQDKLKNSYINFQEYLKIQTGPLIQNYQQIDCKDFNPNTNSGCRKTKMQTFSQYNKTISQKMKNLYGLIGKISMIDNNLVHQFQGQKFPIIVKQYQSNFNSITKTFNCEKSLKQSEEYKKFLGWAFSNKINLNQAALQEAHLITQNTEPNQQNMSQEVKPKIQFQFFKKKIIQIETLVNLNRIISTFNLISFISEQISDELEQEKQFDFQTISHAISTEFRNQTKPKEVQQFSNIGFQQENNKSNLFVQTDENGCWIVLGSNNKKIIYPSSIANIFQFMKYLLHLSALLTRKGLFSQQMMAQILTLKAQQICKWGQIAHNIYRFTKSKQTNCYPLLRKYICLMMQSFYINQLNQIQLIQLTESEKQGFEEQLKRVDEDKDLLQDDKLATEQRLTILNSMTETKVNKFITHYALKAKKADYISQIIFELDNNYDITPVVKLLVHSEEYHHRTHYFQDNVYFYQTVLNEIIQMRNHIKLDHYYSFPKIHQNFGFFTIKVKTFGQILNELAQQSKSAIKIEGLLRFFDIQLKLKRLIFKGQLYWTDNLSFGELLKGSYQNFKDFVQQLTNSILSYSQKPMAFFLENIDDFQRKVSLFQRQVQRLYFYQVIAGKASLSKIKIKNLQQNIKNLSFQQLEQISKFLCSTNLIQQIFKEESCSNQLLSDIRMSIQLNGKIKEEDINRTVNLIDQKTMLSDYMFFLKAFGFDLDYLDCMSIFQIKKCVPKTKDTLKLLINRQKKNMLKHYNQALYQDKKAILLTISFYQKLIAIVLIQILSQFTNENDKGKVSQILQSFHSYSLFSQLYQLRSCNYSIQAALQESLERVIKQKMFLLKFQTDIVRRKVQPKQYTTKLIQNLCLISKISGVGQRKIVLKIQNIYHQILLKQRASTNHKMSNELDYLNNRLKDTFFKQMRIVLIQSNASAFYVNALNNQKQIREIVNQLSKHTEEILQRTSQFQSQAYKNKKQLYLFDQLRGYKIQPQSKASLQASTKRNKDIFKKNDRKYIKKGIFSPVRGIQEVYSNILQNIQRRVSIQMIKESMPLRKIISQLQLEDKKMRDQIVWETSKLQHNVIKKIHKFIAESNIDQKQSYLNFKHTVNLETIKGMENVIEEQTQLYIKTTKLQQKIKRSQPKQHTFFVTEQNNSKQDEEQNKLQYQNTRILNSNIQSIFAHLKKIRVFAAWKKLNRNTNLTVTQWQKFNQNVSNILHNNKNMKTIQQISDKRQNCFKENVFCCLLKQQNKMFSQKIRDQKIISLSKKLSDYKEKYCLGTELEMQLNQNQIN